MNNKENEPAKYRSTFVLCCNSDLYSNPANKTSEKNARDDCFEDSLKRCRVLKLAEFRANSGDPGNLVKLKKRIKSLRTNTSNISPMIMELSFDGITFRDVQTQGIIIKYGTDCVKEVFPFESSNNPYLVIGFKSDLFDDHFVYCVYEIVDGKLHVFIGLIEKIIQSSCRTIVPYNFDVDHNVANEVRDAAVQVVFESAYEIADKLFNVHFLRLNEFVLRISKISTKLLDNKRQTNRQQPKIGMVSFVKHMVSYFDEKKKRSAITQGNVPTRPEFKEVLESCKICFQASCEHHQSFPNSDLKTRLVLVFNLFKRIIDVARALGILDEIKNVQFPLLTSQTRSIMAKHLGQKRSKIFGDLGKSWGADDEEQMCDTIIRLRRNESSNDFYSSLAGNRAFYQRLNNDVSNSSGRSLKSPIDETYLVIADYEAQDPKEISISTGETVSMFSQQRDLGGGAYCLIRKSDNRKGFVPKNVLSSI